MPPLSISVLFLPYIPSRLPQWTPWTSTHIACASFNEYYGPTGTTVLRLNLVRHDSVIQHVQSTAYRILLEIASWKHAHLRSPVKYPSRRARQNSLWSRLQPRWSWGDGNSRIHTSPSTYESFYDFNPHRSALDLPMHPRARGPRPWPQALLTRRSHRSRRRLEAHLLPTPAPLRLEPATPLLLGPRQILHAPPTPRTRLATPTPHRGIPTNTSCPDFPLSPPAATSLY